MPILLIDQLHHLKSCREQWNDVAGNKPFQSWEWCFNWIRQIDFSSQPFVLVETDENGQWKSIAPMARCKTKFGENKIYVMGSGKICTDYTGLITNDVNSFSKKIANWLAERNENDSENRIEIIEFEGVESQSEQFVAIRKALQNAGFVLHDMPLESCWKITLPGSWDELNQSFSKKHRRKTKKAIQRLADTDVQIRSALQNDFESTWDSFVDLHQQRRNNVGDSGCFVNSDFSRFLKSSVTKLANRGLANIFQIELRGKPIASTLFFHDRKNLLMYQTGFDPNVSTLEPGYLLIVATLKFAIENNFETFDFLRGDEPYKARWSSKQIPLSKMRFVDSSTFGSCIRDTIWTGNRKFRSSA
ncbi:MAG: GNAT family N-acetyltransferase, partial [Planctomycetota bacterium]